MISSAQCRGARGLLRWSQEELARRAGVGLSTVRDFEAERRKPYPANMEAILGALEQAGVEFIDENGGGPGVRLRNREESERS
jgi:transcriptional regulator with XRE-family HTH domain